MWGDGHRRLLKPHICLTADISGALRKRRGASSYSGLANERGRRTDEMRGRKRGETIPFMLIASSLYHARHMFNQTASYALESQREGVRLPSHKVRGVSRSAQDKYARATGSSGVADDDYCVYFHICDELSDARDVFVFFSASRKQLNG